MRAIQTALLMAAFLLVVALFAAPQPAFARCLDYWAVGPSGCSGKEPEKTEKKKKTKKAPTEEEEVAEDPDEEEEVAEEEQTEEEKKEAKLQKDIEQFYNRHGKPPEEFVRFYMDPSPQNALAWVKKYNESIQRSRQLAAAWTQAQQIYNNFDEQGLELPPELLPEYARTHDEDLPPVQDLGLELPPGMEDVFGAKPQTNTPAPAGDTSSAIGGLAGSDRLQVMGENRSIGGAPVEASEDLIKISYYFSAKCPYCKKFEPGFSRVIKDMKGKLEVTCVDMTPGGQAAENVHEGIQCQWRPLLPGEKNAMGVEATPTIIVDRGPEKPLERLSGYVDEGKLRDYIEKGPKTQ